MDNDFSKNNIQILIDNYLSNTSIKTPNDMPLKLKNALIKFNIVISSSSAPDERLFIYWRTVDEKNKRENGR